MTENNISKRAQVLLKLLIETYILNGQPISSKYLADNSNLSVSSATVRNILAELEDKGFLSSPHTSAGRIPTEQGYRLFINTLLQVKNIDSHMIQDFQNRLANSTDKKHLMQNASQLLSNITRLAGVVSLPRPDSQILHHVEFLPLSGFRILVIFVLNGDDVQNRIVTVERDYSKSELEKIGNYLNDNFAGKELVEVRQEILNSLKNDRKKMSESMHLAVSVAERAITNEDVNKDYLIAGQQNLLDIANEAGIEQLRGVFNAFTEKQKILGLFDKCLQAEGLHIFIGRESGLSDFANCSVITAPYSIDGQVVGVLGVVGPTRMAYDNVIPLVDVTARILSSALN